MNVCEWCLEAAAREPAEEVDHSDAGHNHEPEPDDEEDHFVEQVDRQHTVHLQGMSCHSCFMLYIYTCLCCVYKTTDIQRTYKQTNLKSEYFWTHAKIGGKMVQV